VRKVFKNSIYQISYQVIIMILPVITIPIVSRALGPSGIGFFSFVNSIVQYFVLFAGLGLATYGIREIATSRGSKEQLSRKFWELQIFNAIVALVVICVYFIFAFFMDNVLYYLIVSMILFGTLFDITWFFSGIEDFKKITLVGGIIKIAAFIAIVLFIHDKGDLVLYFVIQSLANLLMQLSLWLFVFKKIHFVRIKLKDAMQHFKPALAFFVGRISITLYTNMNRTILGILATTAIVGFYTQSLALTGIFVTLITAFDTVLLPRMSKMAQENSGAGMHKVLEKTFHFQLFLTIPLCAGLMVINEKMVPWFFGEEFQLLQITVPVLAPLIIIIPLGISVFRQYLAPLDKIKAFNYSVIVGAVIGLGFNLLLIPFIGIWGAIIATLAAEVSVCLIRLHVMLKESEFKFNIKKILCFLFSAAVMYAVVWISTRGMDSSVLTTVMQVLIGAVVYFVLVTILRVNVVFDISRELRK